MANETPSRPLPPLMANAIKNFHFDFLHPSLKEAKKNSNPVTGLSFKGVHLV